MPAVSGSCKLACITHGSSSGFRDRLIYMMESHGCWSISSGECEVASLPIMIYKYLHCPDGLVVVKTAVWPCLGINILWYRRGEVSTPDKLGIMFGDLPKLLQTSSARAKYILAGLLNTTHPACHGGLSIKVGKSGEALYNVLNGPSE